MKAIANARRRRSGKLRVLRRGKLVAVGMAVLILAGLAGGIDITYAQVKQRADGLQAALTSDLEAGQQELEAGKTSLSEANSKHDVGLVAKAVVHFNAARTDFASAARTADSSHLLRDLEMTPAIMGLVRTRHTAVDGISSMGVALADAGDDVAGLDAQLIKPPGTGQATHTMLTVLDEAQLSFGKVKADLQRAQTAAASIDLNVVPSGQQATFNKARNTIEAALADMDEFQRLVPILRDILGADGVRNYLIEQVNPAELRAGGGFIGTFSILRTENGVMSVVRSGPASQLADPRPNPGDRNFIPLPSPYREIIPQVSWSFLDSNMFADFPSNAKAALAFVNPRLGMTLDGVISVDFYVIADLLKITGPIQVPGTNITLAGDTFISQLMPGDVAGTNEHYKIISAVAGPLMQLVASLPADRWPSAISAIGELATQRHLQAYFTRGPLEAEMDTLGVSGVVNPTAAADYMMEVEDNYFGNKANYFISRRFTVEVNRVGDVLRHKVVIDLRNDMPLHAMDRTAYKADVRLFTGATASDLWSNLRVPVYPDPAPPNGTRMVDGWPQDVQCCGGTGQIVFEYNTPWAPTLRMEQIYWQKQPGTANDIVTVVWNPTNSQSYTIEGSLAQDLVVDLTMSGAAIQPGQQAQVRLPNLNFG